MRDRLLIFFCSALIPPPPPRLIFPNPPPPPPPPPPRATCSKREARFLAFFSCWSFCSVTLARYFFFASAASVPLITSGSLLFSSVTPIDGTSWLSSPSSLVTPIVGAAGASSSSSVTEMVGAVGSSSSLSSFFSSCFSSFSFSTSFFLSTFSFFFSSFSFLSSFSFFSSVASFLLAFFPSLSALWRCLCFLLCLCFFFLSPASSPASSRCLLLLFLGATASSPLSSCSFSSFPEPRSPETDFGLLFLPNSRSASTSPSTAPPPRCTAAGDGDRMVPVVSVAKWCLFDADGDAAPAAEVSRLASSVFAVDPSITTMFAMPLSFHRR
mmetsp:Transcript_22042/g.86678  ORF Transcript_22042/g.86678 Transcript_22042/m.86678 type:complete len:326 (-) Transcript_22042:1731-2708(-)